jgi:hypothetical protein
MKTRLALGLMSMAVASAFAQTPDAWTGQAQCQLTVQSQGYTHQEIQTWTITGNTQSAPGSIQVYPASWSASSQGTSQRVQGLQTLGAQWAGNVPPMPNAQLAIFVRGSDKRLIVKSYHSQLVAHGALVGARVSSAPGAAPTQSAINSAVSEWQFPAVEDVDTTTNVSGTGTIPIAPSALPMGMNAVGGVANCKWQFTKGSAQGTNVPSIRTVPLTGGAPGGNPTSTPQNIGMSGVSVPGTTSTGIGQTGTTSTGQSSSQSQGTTGASGHSCPSLTGTGGETGGLRNAVILGTSAAGIYTTISESLTSQTATKFYRFALAQGADATITLNAGSDFDLYAYDLSGNSLGCSQTHGSNSETLTTRFGNSQNNDVVVEVAAHDWSASSSNFTLKISAANLGSVSLPTQPNKTVYTPNSGNAAAPSSSCTDPGGVPTSTSVVSPTVLGYLNTGQFQTYSGNLNSVNDRRFLQVTVKPGSQASISLNAGSDYDLYIFNSSHEITNCATTHGSNSENIKIQFDSSQTDTTVVIEVAAYGWTSGASTFTLTVEAENPVTATQLPAGIQNRPVYVPVTANSSSASPQCGDPGGSPTTSTLAIPIVMGTIGPGEYISSPGTLTSVTDRRFYQVTVRSGAEASISLTGGSDYDLYFFSSPASLTGCSTTRGTGGETYITHFGNSQSNTITIEVAAYSWSADTANFNLKVSGVQ